MSIRALSNGAAYLPYRTKRLVRWYATVRLYRRKVNPRSAPAGRHFFTSPLAPVSMQTSETNIFLFSESPTNPATDLSSSANLRVTPRRLFVRFDYYGQRWSTRNQQEFPWTLLFLFFELFQSIELKISSSGKVEIWYKFLINLAKVKNSMNDDD